jgi:hypothetical protein
MPYCAPGPRRLAAEFAPLLVMAWLGCTTALAEALQAVVAGGLIAGDWAGTPFTNASCTVAATYDAAIVQSVALVGRRRFIRA